MFRNQLQKRLPQTAHAPERDSDEDTTEVRRGCAPKIGGSGERRGKEYPRETAGRKHTRSPKVHAGAHRGVAPRLWRPPAAPRAPPPTGRHRRVALQVRGPHRTRRPHGRHGRSATGRCGDDLGWLWADLRSTWGRCRVGLGPIMMMIRIKRKNNKNKNNHRNW